MTTLTTKKTAPANRPDVRPARRRLGVQERRDQLLELGINAFGARSYDDVSIDDVAGEAGISKGLLYHYFPTKRDFYVATIEVVAKRLADAVHFPEETRPLLRLSRGLEAYFRFVRDHGAAYASLMRCGIGADSTTLRIVEATRAEISERFLEVIPKERITPLTRLTIRGGIGFVEATSLAWIDFPSVSEEELVGLWATTLVGFMSHLVAEPE